MGVSFVSAGQKTYVERVTDGSRNTVLEPAVYTIEFSREEGFYLLNIQSKYSIPEKVYGDPSEAAKRVIHTHLSKKGNTGVLLTGLKGTGKSLFIKVIGNEMLKLGYPVIQINKAFNGDDLFNFVETLGDCVILFDEFGKNYSAYNGGNAPSQASLLSMLDGLSNSKRLHLFTENRKEDITPFMINRPGRVHYHFKYNRLPEEIIREVCADAGIPNEVTEEVVELSTKINVLSFDVLKCVVEEWKLYGGKVEELLELLNITTVTDTADCYLKIVSCTTKSGGKFDVSKLTARLNGNVIYMGETDKRSSVPQFGLDVDESPSSDRLDIGMVTSVKGNAYTFKSGSGNEFVILIPVPFGE